jgi:hypothetical protein
MVTVSERPGRHCRYFLSCINRANILTAHRRMLRTSNDQQITPRPASRQTSVVARCRDQETQKAERAAKGKYQTMKQGELRRDAADKMRRPDD